MSQNGMDNGASRPGKVLLVVHGWSTECGHCGYGRGGWQSSNNPALEGKPILGPDSRVCHGCGEHFTHVRGEYAGAPLGDVAIEPASEAA